jgi:hypothetical protein
MRIGRRSLTRSVLTPEDVGVELAERLVLEPVAKSDRRRQRLLASWQLRDLGLVL